MKVRPQEIIAAFANMPGLVDAAEDIMISQSAFGYSNGELNLQMWQKWARTWSHARQ